MDLFGYYSDRENAKGGIAEADSFYISSCHSDVIVRVVKSPMMDKNGHIVEAYNLTILDRLGNTLREISNEDGNKSFKEELVQLQKQYNLKNCKRFNNLKKASEYCIDEPGKKIGVANENLGKGKELNSKPEIKQYTFAQAINHVTEERPTRVVVNKVLPSYIALSSIEANMLKIIVLNNKRLTEEVFYIPLVKEKNSDGYKTLSKIMDKYNFHDEVEEFDSIDDARKYTEQKDKEQKKNIRL